MTLNNPLGLTLLALIPLIILLHSIITRRTNQTVPSLVLWDRLLREHRRTVRLKRLIRNLNLLLQLLAVAVMSFAFARPSFTRPREDRDLILVVDASASMKSRESGAARYEEAKREALAAVDALGEESRGMLIFSRSEPVLASSFTTDKERLKRLIRDSRPTDEAGDMAAAMVLAQSLRNPERGGDVVLVTDGAFDLGDETAAPRSGLSYRAVGEPAPNVGITRFRWRRRGDDYEIFLALRNFWPAERSVTLSLGLDGAELYAAGVDLGAEEEKLLVLPFTTSAAVAATAIIAEEDALPTDNAAYAVLSQPSDLRVLLAGPGNAFLAAFLASLRGVRFDIAEAPPSEPASASSGGLYDLVIYDRTAPPAPSSGRFLLIGAPAPELGLEAVGSVELPAVTGWESDHPILQDVDLRRVVITEAVVTDPAEAWRPLVRAAEAPLLLALQEPERRGVFLAFDLLDSDLPLRTQFPLLMANVMRWLAPGRFSFESSHLRAGEPYALPAGDRSPVVIRPDGRSSSPSRTAATYTETSEAGFYAVQNGGERLAFAVNLLDARESDIRPRFQPPAAQEPGAAEGSPLALWPFLALAAFVVLLVEWYLWMRKR